MRTLTPLTITVLLTVICGSAIADNVGDFLADCNQFGYQGTVTNTTKVLGPYAFPTPRDGSVYFAQNVSLDGYSGANYNQIMSDWYQHPQSNQNPGFFQLGDGPPAVPSITSAVGGWTQNAGLWDFTLTVTGVNATYPNTYARLWQPDANHAWGGTFTSYSYTISATGMQTEVVGDWRYSTTDPTGITGAFDGTFVSTQLVWKGPMVDPGDTYVVHLDFNKTYWDGTDWSGTYEGVDYGNYSKFGAVTPEPATMAFLALGGVGVGGRWIRRRKAVRA
ncbi:MAG: PEP-CTERM sorting domain-containing protein [Phycisphaerae bacterium]|nr:PEP-CTERM sorting domain-containing protein [Phycisphaerae bacterium]